MLRGPGAAVAVLALLCGLSAAPYTHAHHAVDAVSDEHHPHGSTLVHTHASPHTHAPHSHGDADPHQSVPPGDEERDEQTWSVDTFVFQPPVASGAPAPALVEVGEPFTPLTGVRVAAARPQPRAHGPPIGSPSGLRAPPALLPQFS